MQNSIVSSLMCNIRRLYVPHIHFEFKDSICDVSAPEDTEKGIYYFST